MEVVQWTSLWGFFKNEYETEKNLLGGALGAKAAGDLKLSITDHVLLYVWSIVIVILLYMCPLNLNFCSVQDIAWLSPSTMRGLPSVGLQNLLSLSL